MNNTDKSNTDKSNTDKSNTDKSNTDKSNTNKSNTDESNTDKPNTDESNTDESNTDESNKNKSNKNKSNKNKSNNIIPYIIAFAILFILALIVLTWMLDRWYKNRTCDNDPYIWCSDNWICEISAGEDGTCNGSSGKEVNGCYKDATTIGLSSCLFGITSTSATICTTAGTSGTSGPTCPCAITRDNSSSTSNCLIGCPISGQQQDSECCCCPGTKGCHFKSVEEFCNQKDAVDQACVDRLESEDNIVCKIDCDK